jgi:hypothetical protein
MGFRVEHLPQLRALRNERKEDMVNRMLTPSELITFAVRNADHIRATWGGGATDQVSPRLRRRLARDQEFGGEQGRNRPPSATPENDGDEYGELLALLRERLDPEDYHKVCSMLGIEEDERPPHEYDDEERAGQHRLERSGAVQPEGEDEPPPFEGRPRPGGAQDHRAQMYAQSRRIGFDSFPTQSEQAAARRATRAKRTRRQIAQDIRAAASRPSGAGFLERFPEAARIGFR